MKHFILFCWLCACLTGCAFNPLFALTVPEHPLYVIAGQNAVPGYGEAAISLIDRDRWQLIGTRHFQTSYVHQATSDGQSIWFGLAGDINNDAAIVKNIGSELQEHTTYHSCLEPKHVHLYQQSLIVVCPEYGVLGRVQRIDIASGAVLAETEINTQWGSMYVDFSYLIQDKLYIEGSSFHPDDTGPMTVLVLDATTLVTQRTIHAEEILSTADVVTDDAGTVYLLNYSSLFLQHDGKPFADIYMFDQQTSRYIAQPLIQRSPVYGAILGDFLYTVHFTEKIVSEHAPSRVEIHKTHLRTWEHTYWYYASEVWSTIGDMAVVDGRILLTKYNSTDPQDDGIYELNTDTGALTQRIHIPGASLIVDMPKTP